MAKKRAAKKAKKAKKARQLTPPEIVAKWRHRIEVRLGDWYLVPGVFTEFVPKLENNIQQLMDDGRPFTGNDMQGSLKVAGDMARILKILQPDDYRVTKDTFEAVLELCATNHQSCSDGGGLGGWCMV